MHSKYFKLDFKKLVPVMENVSVLTLVAYSSNVFFQTATFVFLNQTHITTHSPFSCSHFGSVYLQLTDVITVSRGFCGCHK